MVILINFTLYNIFNLSITHHLLSSKHPIMIQILQQSIRFYPSISIGVMMLIFSMIGYLIVTRYLMEKQIRNFFSKFIFTVTFSCSVSLLAIYLSEILDLKLPSEIWDIMLSLLVIICTIVTPLTLLLKLPYATKSITIIGTNFQIPLIAVFLVLMYLKLISVWSSEIQNKKQIEEQIHIFTKQHINILVQILVDYGVVIMATMSAYGAVWVPYIYLNHTQTKREDLLGAKKKIRSQIFFIIQQIKKNKYSIIKLKQQRQKLTQQIEQFSKQSQQMSFLQRGLKSIKSAISTSSQSQKRNKLLSIIQKIDFHQKQIDTLNRVHHQSYSIYREIVDEERKHMISETVMGKIFRIFSFILTLYSISKFVLTAWNMYRGRKLGTDPITRFLGYLNDIFGMNQYNSLLMWSQYISFIFMGYLMISSVRSFSINIKNFFDFILRRRRLNMISTDTLVLLLSEMYGIYFLSAVILLQSTLPRNFITRFQHFNGKTSLIQHFTWFDKLFFWSCILSLILIAISQLQRKQKMNVIKQRNFVQICV